MQRQLLPILRCPFCGSALSLSDSPCPTCSGSEVVAGVLECDCCAYPVVAGIPYLQANRLIQTVLQQLHGGDHVSAFQMLAGLDPASQADLADLLQGDGEPWTFRRALSLFCPGSEGDYFFFRYSDPTFLVGEGMVSALASAWPLTRGRILDLCGGTGHLTRVLQRVQSQADIVVADRDFWKVWLARRYLAPQCDAICCDAAQPLPWARGSFDWVVCSDALNYIWPRRLLVSEMCRLTASPGLALVLHMHNALADNPSEGMPLRTGTFRTLFESLPVRLYPERTLLASWVADRSLNLAQVWSDSALGGEQAYCGLATEHTSVYRDYETLALPTSLESWRINPLYAPDPSGSSGHFKRQFPTQFYESEYAASKLYLPESVEIDLNAVTQGGATQANPILERLVAQRVLLDLPEHYG